VEQRRSRFAIASLVAAGVVIIAGTWGWLQRGSTAVLPTAPETATISVAKLAEGVIAGQELLVLDVRSTSDFLASHVPGAVSMPTYDILRSEDELARFTDWKTVLICGASNCPELEQALRDLRLLGFQDLHELEGGMDAYRAADLTLSSQAKLIQDDLVNVLRDVDVPTITVTELRARTDVTIIDTRTPFEFATGFIAGAVDLPLYTTQVAIEEGHYGRPQDDRTIVVYDRVGNRSRLAAQTLIDAGFKNVLSLEGGIEAWTADGGELSFPAEDGSDLEQLIPTLTQE
jgi:rhodanese-related sulfurtransferase